jgi:hypothetical protein
MMARLNVEAEKQDERRLNALFGSLLLFTNESHYQR